MPPQVKKSGLAAKYGATLDNAIKQHAADETNYGVIRLPGGISNGIAQLVECGFGIFKPGTANQGEYYFRAAGVVVEPKTVVTKTGEVSVAGLQTSIIIPLCDTKTAAGEIITQEKHAADILNEFRKLGADTRGATLANFEDIAAALKQAAPYFRFSTSESAGGGINPKTKRPYEPRVWENWHGSQGLENYTGPGGGGGTSLNDGTGDIDPAMLDQMDLDSLAERADNDDVAAQAQLTAFAEAKGITDGQMEACTGGWHEVVALIKGEEPGQSISVGQNFKFKPPGPGKKFIEVEVVSLNGETAEVRDLSNPKKVYKGVKFASLEAI